MFYKRLYVGDLAPDITERQLYALFSQAGTVESVNLITRYATPVFAFVEMATPEATQLAIAKYNGYDLAGSRLIVYAVPPHRNHHQSI